MFPSISQAQIVAVLTWVVSQAVAYGAIDNEQSKIILSLAASVIGAAWLFADGWRHHGNAKVKAAAIASSSDTTAELKKANAA